MATVPSLADVDGIDNFARGLYMCARQSGPAFNGIAAAVRSLHSSLKRLKADLRNPAGSLLARDDTSRACSRQLRSVVEDCDFALKQVNTLLDRYGAPSASSAAPDAASSSHETRDAIELVRVKVVGQKTNIDLFLDTVHSPGPDKRRRADDADDATDAVVDKFEAVAKRVFSRRREADGGRRAGDDDHYDRLWDDFTAELVAEGFDSKILRQNKETLRAYILELEANSLDCRSSPIAIRDGPRRQSRDAFQPGSAPRNTYMPNERLNSTMYPVIDDRLSSIKNSRPAPSPQAPPSPASTSKQLSFERRSSDSSNPEEPDPSAALALISTRDLMKHDVNTPDPSLAHQLRGLALSPPNLLPPPSNFSASPDSLHVARFLPSSGQPQPLSASTPSASGHSLPAAQLSSSPAVASSGFPTEPGRPSQTPVSPPAGSKTSRLAPDSYGKDIPLDAKWTRIRRTLVSPEVLEQAGVRYEARPQFVAVLGVLTREEIAIFARRSAEVRAARGRLSTAVPRQKSNGNHSASRPRRTSSVSDSGNEPFFDDGYPSDTDSIDAGDRRHGKRPVTRPRPVVVSPPSSAELFPATTSSGSASATFPPGATSAPGQLKSILKKPQPTENHVRFDVSADEANPAEPSASVATTVRPHRSGSGRDKGRDHSKHYYEHRDGGAGRRREDDDRIVERHSSHGHHRDDRRDSYPPRGATSHRRHGGSRGAERVDSGQRRDSRQARRRAWGETIGAVSIGSAAASLLTVLTEAASAL